MTAVTALRQVAECRKHIGFREGPNNDTPWGKRFGMNHQPYCDMFQCCCGEDTSKGRTLIGWFAYTPSHAEWFKRQKRWGTTPKVGAIVFFHWPSMGRIAHVGIVEAIRADGSIVTIEANTNPSGSRDGGGVYRMVRRANIAGYGYPAYAPGPKPTVKKPPTGRRLATNPFPRPNYAKFKIDCNVTDRHKDAMGSPVQWVQWQLGQPTTGRVDRALTNALGRFQHLHKLHGNAVVDKATGDALARL